jgi:hypothetical protein
MNVRSRLAASAAAATLVGGATLATAGPALAVVPSPPTPNVASCVPATIVNFGGAPTGTPGLFEHLVIGGGPGLGGGVVAAAHCD